MIFFYLLCLGFAVSIDGFIAGIAYGLKNIRIPLMSLLIICVTTIISTVIALLAASILGTLIYTKLAILFGALLLILIGLFSIFQEYITTTSPNHPIMKETDSLKLTFSIGRLVISIMADPEKADVDHSKAISSLEAFFLGLALGIDNMIATFATALVEPLPSYTSLIMGFVQMLVIAGGVYTSKHYISDRLKKHFSYLPGLILILLGCIRLY